MKTKLCRNCKKVKNLSEFHIDKLRKDGLCYSCKECKNLFSKIYYQNNRVDRAIYSRLRRKNNPDYYAELARLRRQQTPWKYTLLGIKARCNNPNSKDYKYYGGRGIKCLITEEELKKLWFRDKAYKMKKPSIDREDNDGNYIIDNCSYIEFLDNVIKENIEKKKRKLEDENSSI